MFKLSILNVEKYGDSLINDNMFKATDEFFYDAFACKPCFKFNEVSKNEYIPLNEDIRKFYITPIYKMRDKIKYNYSVEINIDKDIFTSDSGRICVTGIMIVASPILINKDELTTSEYVNEFNNSNSYDEFENYADKFNTKFIYYMSYYLYDYKILGNNISFEYVDINYDYY